MKWLVIVPAAVLSCVTLACAKQAGDAAAPENGNKPPETAAAGALPVYNDKAVDLSGLPAESRHLYRLPWESGKACLVSQGTNGSLTHFEGMAYALDFLMDEGSPLLAARDGIVITVVQHFTEGSTDEEQRYRGNTVEIRHDDGTIAFYHHLLHNGAKVKVGEQVKTGQLIALSGNTGFSGAPHLHFQVDKISGNARQSLPVLFLNQGGGALAVIEGIRYRAPYYDPAGNALPETNRAPAGMGALGRMRDELATLIAAETDLAKASRLFSDWLAANRPRLRQAWEALNSRVQARDQTALRELEWFLNQDDIASDRRFARILDPANPHKEATDAGLSVVWQLTGAE